MGSKALFWHKVVLADRAVIYINFKKLRGWRDGSGLKRMCYSRRGLSSVPSAHKRQLTTPVTPARGDPTSLASKGTNTHMAYAHTNIHNSKVSQWWCQEKVKANKVNRNVIRKQNRPGEGLTAPRKWTLGTAKHSAGDKFLLSPDALASMSNLWPTAHMQLRIAMNSSQWRIIHFT